ncbi:MAG: hypothetical protein ACYDCO_03515 [Armatimonadota bacterium]
MQEVQCPADLKTIPLEELCLWSDQSMGFDDPDITQDYDDTPDVDKIGTSTMFHWEYVPAHVPDERRCGHGAFSFRRVRLPLSVLHPSLRDIEFWTLDLRSTVLLVVVLAVLVSFGAALFA